MAVSKTSNHFQGLTQSAMKSTGRHLVLKKVNTSEHTEDTRIWFCLRLCKFFTSLLLPSANTHFGTQGTNALRFRDYYWNFLQWCPQFQTKLLIRCLKYFNYFFFFSADIVTFHCCLGFLFSGLINYKNIKPALFSKEDILYYTTSSK